MKEPCQRFENVDGAFRGALTVLRELSFDEGLKLEAGIASIKISSKYTDVIAKMPVRTRLELELILESVVLAASVLREKEAAVSRARSQKESLVYKIDLLKEQISELETQLAEKK